MRKRRKSIRYHLLLHAKKADRAWLGGASRARARETLNEPQGFWTPGQPQWAGTNLRRAALRIFCSFLPWTRSSPRAAPGLASPLLVTALRVVISTPNWGAVKKWESRSHHLNASLVSPHGNVHVPKFGTNNCPKLPATALVRSRPECGQAAPWRPRLCVSAPPSLPCWQKCLPIKF